MKFIESLDVCGFSKMMMPKPLIILNLHLNMLKHLIPIMTELLILL